MTIKAQCSVCKGFALADQFKLHHTYRKMVCPNCFSGKTKQQQEMKKVEPQKPLGWDKDDEYLEKISRMRKQEDQAQFEKIPGTDHVKCTCPHCKYTFRYDPFRKIPKTCPYCNNDVPKLKTFTLL